MFTGIITDIGRVKNITQKDGLIIEISTIYDLKSVDIGASISCNGVCLTVTEKTANSFIVDVSFETINCTNIEKWQIGTKVNLERAMQIGDEFGGHIVSGHIDGRAIVKNISKVENAHLISFEVEKNLSGFIASKGSIALDGISLTVNNVTDNEFDVAIIPHTYEHTNFSDLQVNDTVNIEVDMLARYVARILQVQNS